MSKSCYEYIKEYECDTKIPKNCFFVVRIDGNNFKKFSEKHNFTKPVDFRGIQLCNISAESVLNFFSDIILAYGQSDEYSFLFRRDTNIWKRKQHKIVSCVVSLFTSSYVLNWSNVFDVSVGGILYAPHFDGKIVLLPTEQNVADYFKWRQVDCHINFQYNICFWSLVQKAGMNHDEAYNMLKNTKTADKNEMLYSKFSINYNDLSEVFRRGTILIRNIKKEKKENKKSLNEESRIDGEEGKTEEEKRKIENEEGIIQTEEHKHAELLLHSNKNLKNIDTKPCIKEKIKTLNDNMISNSFWEDYSWIFQL